MPGKDGSMSFGVVIQSPGGSISLGYGPKREENPAGKPPDNNRFF